MELLPKSVKAKKGLIVTCTKCHSKFICRENDPAIHIVDDLGGYEAFLTCTVCHQESGPLPPAPNYR
jgi:hypothetical protein